MLRSPMFRDLASKLWPLKLAVAAPTPDTHVLPNARPQGIPHSMPDTETDVLQDIAGRVILFNDNLHTFDEVGLQIAKATGCTWDEGEAQAWRVHAHGRAPIFEGDVLDCVRVSSVLEEIALRTQVIT